VKKMTMHQFQKRYKSEPLYMVSGSIHGDESQREREQCPIDNCPMLKHDLRVPAGDQTRRHKVWDKIFESIHSQCADADPTDGTARQEQTSFWYCNGAESSGPHETAGRRLPIVTRTHRDDYYTTTMAIGEGHKVCRRV
jgi:hypothetical protein